MTSFAFHASHEQVPPGELVAAVVRAEAAGFDVAMSSDHFSPWSERQGQSAFAWSWLGVDGRARTSARPGCGSAWTSSGHCCAVRR